MPLIPGPDVYRELRMLGTIISAITYGIVVSLSGNCFFLLLKKRGIYSSRMRLFLLIYVTIMLLLSTLAIMQTVRTTTVFIFQADLPLVIGNIPAALPLIIWGADGFMIWRCAVLYQDVPRVPRFIVLVLLSFLSITSLVCGVMSLIPFSIRFLIGTDGIFSTVVTLFSTLVNIILAALIILRLIRHQRHIRKVLGAQHGSPYSKVITMCVESSALIVIFSGVYSVIALVEGDGPSGLIPFLLLPHICVISPLLIVYRVAKGRAVTTTLHPSEEVADQIRFNDPPSSRSNQEEREV
ncbi:hypothetical protein M413DRAFT_382915 [Hebeloma cylindrosporum]|uniref:G-protein coupled receptors family 1 profile domain-containing protein n=1 Tax=Hebeloma cylindrosporum TaxID=76867 RepID=A0A0C3CH86_HEBCY|nr:hypothetical protein M413DRAFT_382915 [Hebeloma cylindrosporum h7]